MGEKDFCLGIQYIYIIYKEGLYIYIYLTYILNGERERDRERQAETERDKQKKREGKKDFFLSEYNSFAMLLVSALQHHESAMYIHIFSPS